MVRIVKHQKYKQEPENVFKFLKISLKNDKELSILQEVYAIRMSVQSESPGRRFQETAELKNRNFYMYTYLVPQARFADFRGIPVVMQARAFVVRDFGLLCLRLSTANLHVAASSRTIENPGVVIRVNGAFVAAPRQQTAKSSKVPNLGGNSFEGERPV